ncbi:MliC family protein [Coralloluteibacterium thermophilus]|uniref:MliC family protein n=1 Tax=Coralloluteibacterium thermophilum TaxID=2707049 RepID=A0ABV9NJI2_9GAMM
MSNRHALLFPSIALSALLLAACGNQPAQDAATSPTPTREDLAPPPAQTAQTPEAAPPANLGADGAAAPQPVAGTVTYECEDGFRFHARYGEDNATLTLDDQEIDLPQVVSASGAHYQSDGLSWWTRGNSGTLEQGGAAPRDCREIARAP